MKITYREQEFEFDLDAIDVAQAKVIKVHCGLTLKGITDGIAELDPDAMRAAFWLMHVQSSIPCDIDRINFPLVEFASAIIEAAELKTKEMAEQAENEDGPKDE